MITLSIITINLNNRDGLKTTMESVSTQEYKDFEYIVVDGGSTDGSFELIKHHGSLINSWISEKDNGIYNAMNKGITLAKGKYLLFLNSGDWLASRNILGEVFKKKPESDIIAGDMIYFDLASSKIKWLYKSPDILTADTLFNGTLPHQATFIKSELFATYGSYSEDLKIASDWLFFLDVLLGYNVSYEHYNGVVAYFNTNGISCDPSTNQLPRREQMAVLNQKYPRFIEDYKLLHNLKEDDNCWKNSNEYNAYLLLTKVGIIKLTIYLQKIVKSFYKKS